MSLYIAKFFRRRAALVSAALVIHVGSAMAADSRGDIQPQIKEWLVGTPTAHPSSPSALRDVKETSPGPDAQERAKRLLLGTSSRSGGDEGVTHAQVTEASAKGHSERRSVAYGDVQVAARQLLLGQPQASDARSSAARPTR